MISNRMTRYVLTFSSAALLCGATALAQTGSGNGQDASMSGSSTGKATMADKAFVKKALAGGRAEVQLGRLAAKSAHSEDVKQFGQKMVTDHTKLGDQLKPVAEQMGLNMPAPIPAKDANLMTTLQGQGGSAFDKTYIKAMIKDHHKDLMEFRKEAQTTQDPTLKQIAQQGEQVIQEHLQMAEQLAQAHNVKTGGKHGGSGMGGNDMNGQSSQPQ